MTLTGGRGFDLIVEMLANKNLSADLGLLAKKGRVVVVGNRGTIEINPRDLMSREADVRGVLLFGTSEQESREMHAALGAGLENGTLRPVIAQKIPLAEAARAHEEIMKARAQWERLCWWCDEVAAALISTRVRQDKFARRARSSKHTIETWSQVKVPVSGVTSGGSVSAHVPDAGNLQPRLRLATTQPLCSRQRPAPWRAGLGRRW